MCFGFARMVSLSWLNLQNLVEHRNGRRQSMSVLERPTVKEELLKLACISHLVLQKKGCDSHWVVTFISAPGKHRLRLPPLPTQNLHSLLATILFWTASSERSSLQVTNLANNQREKSKSNTGTAEAEKVLHASTQTSIWRNIVWDPGQSKMETLPICISSLLGPLHCGWRGSVQLQTVLAMIAY